MIPTIQIKRSQLQSALETLSLIGITPAELFAYEIGRGLEINAKGMQEQMARQAAEDGRGPRASDAEPSEPITARSLWEAMRESGEMTEIEGSIIEAFEQLFPAEPEPAPIIVLRATTESYRETLRCKSEAEATALTKQLEADGWKVKRISPKKEG